ncbi:hypothetical protein [Petroclostridium sp. X23]|nr:hypothetical protein [Petroclostridium sp. X23]WHH58528.1 hypothetical protein QKW49_22465 [Petroclostridium sp. X23]
MSKPRIKKSVTIFVLLACFISMLAAYKVLWSPQNLPNGNITMQETSL